MKMLLIVLPTDPYGSLRDFPLVSVQISHYPWDFSNTL